MADEKTRCPKCLAWYNALEGKHVCSEQPIWDSSLKTNTRYRAVESIGMMIPKGSIFEINEVRPAMGIRPPHATVHLLGSMLKMYITRPHLEAVKGKLKEVGDD